MRVPWQCRARAQRWADKLATELGSLQRGGCDGLSGAPHGQNLLVLPQADMVSEWQLCAILRCSAFMAVAHLWCAKVSRGFDGESATMNWVNGPECFKAQVTNTNRAALSVLLSGLVEPVGSC